MFIAHLASCMFVKIPMALVLLQSGSGAQRFSLWEMWLHMQWPARSIAIILLGMSAWSMGVMMDRWLAFQAARKQSRQFAPIVAGALREGKLDEAIRVAERNKKSHLAKVVNAGLLEFRVHEQSTEIPDKIEASRRALERASAIVHAELERGLSGLATIGSNCAFRRVAGHGDRHHRRLPRNSG
jgi:biopolymer transport protein ExbB/TolQ